MKKDWILPICAVLGGLAAQFYFAEPGWLLGEGPAVFPAGVAATLFAVVFLAAGLYVIDATFRLGHWWTPFLRREREHLQGAINGNAEFRSKVSLERPHLLRLYRLRRFILKGGAEYLCLGNALYYLDELDKAVKCYGRALAGEPNLKEAWRNRGAALEQLGRQEEARACFEKAKELEKEA